MNAFQRTMAERARDISLGELLRSHGFEIKPEGITFRARNDRYNIVVTGNRWFDNKAGLGGLGAIDLQMHLTGEDFAAAYQTLARDFRGISTAEIGLSFPIERYIPSGQERRPFTNWRRDTPCPTKRTGRLPAPISSKHARSTPPLWTICTRWERSSPTTTVLIQARGGPKPFEKRAVRGSDHARSEGMEGSGSALLRRGGSADAVILGTQNAAGEWVAIAAATPLSPPQYLAKSTRMDLEFLAVSGPQKRGEWEINLPLGTFGELRSGVLRAWAMDFRRHVLYQLPGDEKFTAISEPNRPSEELAAQERNPSQP